MYYNRIQKNMKGMNKNGWQNRNNKYKTTKRPERKNTKKCGQRNKNIKSANNTYNKKILWITGKGIKKEPPGKGGKKIDFVNKYLDQIATYGKAIYIIYGIIALILIGVFKLIKEYNK